MLQCAGIPIRPSSNENSLNSIAWSWRVPAIGVICEFNTSNNIFLSSCKSFKVVCFFLQSILTSVTKPHSSCLYLTVCFQDLVPKYVAVIHTHFLILIQVRCNLFRIIPKNRRYFLAEIKNKINWRRQRGKENSGHLALNFQCSVIWTLNHLAMACNHCVKVTNPVLCCYRLESIGPFRTWASFLNCNGLMEENRIFTFHTHFF